MSFAWWVQAVTSRRQPRTAIFVENKLVLGVMPCLLVDYIRTRASSHTQDGEEFVVSNECYSNLANVFTCDSAITCDKIPYARFCREECRVPSRQAAPCPSSSPSTRGGMQHDARSERCRRTGSASAAEGVLPAVHDGARSGLWGQGDCGGIAFAPRPEQLSVDVSESNRIELLRSLVE
jgi:hypothetical protein